MEQRAKTLIGSGAPWRSGVPWYIVLIEGAALMALGIYALTATSSARETVFAAFGVLLVVNGGLAALSAIRQLPDRSTAYRSVRAGVALTTGILALVARFTELLDSGGARVILGVGFVIVGLIGLVTMVITRGEHRFSIASAAIQIAFLTLGVLLLTGSEDNDTRFKAFGWLAVIAGGLLVALSILLQRRGGVGAGAPVLSDSGLLPASGGTVVPERGPVTTIDTATSTQEDADTFEDPPSGSMQE